MYTKSTLISLGALVSLSKAVNHDVRTQGLAFIPSTVNAAAGDTVTFHFTTDAHDVAQGSFSSPCMPSSGGFYSGQSVAGKKFVVDIKDTNPIYFYCSVPGHCSGGMVGGINAPNSGNTVSAFNSAARQASSSSSPDSVTGGQLLDESASVSSSPASTSSQATTATTGGTSSVTSAVSSAKSSASSAVSSINSAASSAIASISSAASSAAKSATSAAGGAASSVTSAVGSATSRPASAANSLMVAGGEYGSGKVIVSALAAVGAGFVFWAGLI